MLACLGYEFLYSQSMETKDVCHTQSPVESSCFYPKSDSDSEILIQHLLCPNNKELVVKTIVAPQMTLKASLMNVVMFSGYLIFRMLLLKSG
jgi:hypothetical protein